MYANNIKNKDKIRKKTKIRIISWSAVGLVAVASLTTGLLVWKCNSDNSKYTTTQSSKTIDWWTGAEEDFSVSHKNISKTKTIEIKVSNETYKHYLLAKEISHSKNYNAYKVTITDIPSNFLFHEGISFLIALTLMNNQKFSFEFSLSDFQGIRAIPDSMFTFTDIPGTSERTLTGFTEEAKIPGALDQYDTFVVPSNVIDIAQGAFGEINLTDSSTGFSYASSYGSYIGKKWLSTSLIPNNITKFICSDSQNAMSIGDCAFVGSPFQQAIFHNVVSFGLMSFSLTDLKYLFFDNNCYLEDQTYFFSVDLLLTSESTCTMDFFPSFSFNTNFENIIFNGKDNIEKYTFDDAGSVVGKCIVNHLNRINSGLAYGKINFNSFKNEDEMINQYELYDCASITALYFGHHRMENIIDGALDYDINTGILKLIYKNSLAYFMCFAYMHNLHQIVYDDSILLPIENNMDGVISDYTEGSIADWKLYMEEHLMSNFIPYNDSLNCPYFYNDESFQIYTPYDLDNPSLTDDVILDKVVSLYTEVGTRDFYNPDNPTFYHLSDYQSDVPWF